MKGGSGRGPLRFRFTNFITFQSSFQFFSDPVVSATVIMALFILHNFLVESRTEPENDDGEFLDQYEREMRTQTSRDRNLEEEDTDSDSDSERDELNAGQRLEK